MKVLILNGSPRTGGNCSILIEELCKTFQGLEVETEVVEVGKMKVPGCLACGYCHQPGHQGCVMKDGVFETSAKFKDADGLITVAPVYYGSPNGMMISFLDRLFYSAWFPKKYKVGASFVVARRAGTTASFDVLNKYFALSGMPIASGDYWNNGFGREKGEINEDKEGLRNAREVARRMTFLMKAIADAKINHPELLFEENRVATHFIKNK